MAEINNRIETLIKKLANHTLTTDEKHELIGLLKNKNITLPNITSLQSLYNEHSQQMAHEKQSMIWKRIQPKLRYNPHNLIRFLGKRFQKVAAVLIFTIILAGYFVIDAYRWHQVATKNGEQKTILLSEGSKIVLNGNSQLTFKKYMRSDKPRIVKLVGEGNFQIESATSEQGRFMVHTKDMKIEVIGTTFNVNSRLAETSVFLEEGKVEIEVNEKTLELKPGEKLSYNVRQKTVEQKTIANPINEISWKKGILEYTNAEFAMIMKKIGESNGLSIDFNESIDATRLLTLRIPSNNLDFSLRTIEKLTNTTIIIKDQMIMIKRNEN